MSHPQSNTHITPSVPHFSGAKRSKKKKDLPAKCPPKMPRWDEIARPEQRPPAGDWFAWLILAGRGFGKTRTGAETILSWVRAGTSRRIALVGRTFQEIEHVMIFGASGLLSISPEDNIPVYNKSAGTLTWPCGAQATLFTDATYDKLRGPQFDSAWIDEFAKFMNMRHIWDQLCFSLRVGRHPRMIITTTPRPRTFLVELSQDQSVHVTRGSTLANKDNLPPCFLNNIMRLYGNTALGRQEIEAEFISSGDMIWIQEYIHHMPKGTQPPEMVRTIVAVDPAVTCGENSDETGIISLGQDANGIVWVLGDHSMRARPAVWAERVADVAREIHAEYIVAEVNNGGELVKDLLHSMNVNFPVKSVRARSNKYARANPVASLYMQERVMHVHPFPDLEKQMLDFKGQGKGHSPDRVDALVWGVRHLTIDAVDKVERKRARIWLAPLF